MTDRDWARAFLQTHMGVEVEQMLILAREEGRQEERERCAAIARSFGSPDDLVTLGPYEWYGDLCAAAIVDAITEVSEAEDG